MARKSKVPGQHIGKLVQYQPSGFWQKYERLKTRKVLQLLALKRHLFDIRDATVQPAKANFRCWRSI